MQGRFSYLLYGVLALAVGIWLFSQTGEKRRIASRLEELAELLAKDGPESGLSAASKARSVTLFFARDFEVDLRGYTKRSATSPQEISQALLYYRMPPSRIDVSFRDVEIELDEGERGADMTALGDAAASGDGGLSRRRFRFALRWVKEEREWVIQRAELIEELEPGLF